MAKKFIRITHRASGTKLAEGPVGWGITPFEGNLYIRPTGSNRILFRGFVFINSFMFGWT